MVSLHSFGAKNIGLTLEVQGYFRFRVLFLQKFEVTLGPRAFSPCVYNIHKNKLIYKSLSHFLKICGISSPLKIFKLLRISDTLQQASQASFFEGQIRRFEKVYPCLVICRHNCIYLLLEHLFKPKFSCNHRNFLEFR